MLNLKKNFIDYLVNNNKFRVKKDLECYKKKLYEDRLYYSVCCYRLYIKACFLLEKKQKAKVIRIKQKHTIN